MEKEAEVSEKVTVPAVAADVEHQAGDIKDNNNASNVDAALEFLHAGDASVVSDIDEKKLVRKVDWMIIPLMWACYNLQYLDKVLSMHIILYNDLVGADGANLVRI